VVSAGDYLGLLAGDHLVFLVGRSRQYDVRHALLPHCVTLLSSRSAPPPSWDGMGRAAMRPATHPQAVSSFAPSGLSRQGKDANMDRSRKLCYNRWVVEAPIREEDAGGDVSRKLYALRVSERPPSTLCEAAMAKQGNPWIPGDCRGQARS